MDTLVQKKKVVKKLVPEQNVNKINKELKKIIKKVTNLDLKEEPKPQLKKVVIIKKEMNKNMKYSKKGQTKPTPPENDPLRKFYTSLLYQKPDSEMALKWCIEHGLAQD